MTTPKKPARRKALARKAKKPAAEKRPVGRPTKYTPDMCRIVIEAGKEGCAVAEMASLCDVCIDTIYEWAKVHDEFSEALTRANSEAEAYWARHLRNGMHKPPSEFQGQPNLKYMSIRFQDRWADRQKHEVTGGINMTISQDDAGL